MKPEEVIRHYNALKEDYLSRRSFMVRERIDEISKEVISILEKQAIAKHSKVLKWQKCTRKNGTEFLKLIYYSPDEQGYVELGRFNMTKYEVQNNDWNLDGIIKELE